MHLSGKPLKLWTLTRIPASSPRPPRPILSSSRDAFPLRVPTVGHHLSVLHKQTAKYRTGAGNNAATPTPAAAGTGNPLEAYITGCLVPPPSFCEATPATSSHAEHEYWWVPNWQVKGLGSPSGSSTEQHRLRIHGGGLGSNECLRVRWITNWWQDPIRKVERLARLQLNGGRAAPPGVVCSDIWLRGPP